ncbi:hypothetical protein ACQ3VF_26475 [Bacillus toyonensis]|uniref:hypothetical protein n=1 Tax=Bacillus toyonensis TaxID=155322 RepID=UPI003D303850
MTNDTLTQVTEGTTTLEKATKTRHQLNLPFLHFVAVDDWFEKIGEKSFCMWLKLLTMVDRKNGKDTVKYSQQLLAKTLGVSKPTLIKLLKPLYEYGFIDYIEYMQEGKAFQNVVVFESPLNDDTNLLKPLVKIRDWEKRTEEKFDFTKKGGRPKKQDALDVSEADLPKGMQDLPKEEPKEAPKPVKKAKEVAFNENVNPIVITEFEYWKTKMIENKVDLNVVVRWANKNVDTIPHGQMCYVLKQLATYSEDIHKTGAFISTTMKLVPTFYQPITAPVEPVTEEPAFQPQVKLYNFLEEKGDKPVFNNDDLPF